MSDRIRWTPERPDIDIRVGNHHLTVEGLENIIAATLIDDARSRGKRPPLFAVRYAVARRVTLALSFLVEQAQEAL